MKSAKRIAAGLVFLFVLFCAVGSAHAGTNLDSLKELRHSPLAIAKATDEMLAQGNTDAEVIFANVLIKCYGIPTLTPFAVAPHYKQLENKPLYDLLNLIFLFDTTIPYELGTNKKLTDETRAYVSNLIYARNLMNPDSPQDYKKYFYLFHLLLEQVDEGKSYGMNSATEKQKYFGDGTLFYDAFMSSYALLFGFQNTSQYNFETLFSEIMSDRQNLSMLDYMMFYNIAKRLISDLMKKADPQAQELFTQQVLELMKDDIWAYWTCSSPSSWSPVTQKALEKYSFEDNFEFMPQAVEVLYLRNYKYGSKESIPPINLLQGSEKEIFYKKILSLRYAIVDLTQGGMSEDAYKSVYGLIIEILSSPFADATVVYQICIMMNELNESLSEKSPQVTDLYNAANYFKLSLASPPAVSEALEVAKKAKDLRPISLRKSSV
jgi:hypothetical protein